MCGDQESSGYRTLNRKGLAGRPSTVISTCTLPLPASVAGKARLS